MRSTRKTTVRSSSHATAVDNTRPQGLTPAQFPPQTLDSIGFLQESKRNTTATLSAPRGNAQPWRIFCVRYSASATGAWKEVLLKAGRIAYMPTHRYEHKSRECLLPTRITH